MKGKFLVAMTILGLACGLAVTTCLAQTTDGNAIPSSLFGLTVTHNQNWPTVPFGDLGKGALVRWPYIEQTNGVYNWSNLDTWVSVANAHNIPFHYASNQAPLWAVSNQTSCSAITGGYRCSADVTNLIGWDNFVTALTQRYNGHNGHGFIAVYELYDQPEYSFTGDTANLVAQTTALYNAVKANSPNSLVVGMGVTYPSTYYAPGNYMDKYWAAGGVKTVDAVCFHGYPHHGNDVPEIVNTFVPYITAAMARNGIPANTPIWDTEGSWGDVRESGWTVTDPDQQAAWVARSYLLHWSNGVSRFDWFAWDGYPWGALSISGSGINAAGVAYGQVYNWMVGATMSVPCAASGTVWTCGLTEPAGGQALAVWNTSGTSTYVPVGQYTQYRDLAGNTSAITGGSVTIGIKPILLQTGGNGIPASLFGLTVTYNQNWPTVPFGDLKGTQVSWFYIEQTNGVYKWSNLDTWVSVANAHNIPFHYASWLAPPWAVSDQTSCSAITEGYRCSADVTNLIGWDDFVTALTQRYNGHNGHGFIAVYELYNEPENFFKGDTANLVAQTTALYNAVRDNSPNSLVVGMGVTYPSTYYAPGNYMDKYWAAGGVKTVDAVCFHGYPHHGNDVPEIVNTFVPYITAAMARNGIPANTPIWDTEGSWGDVTESGWNVTDPNQQAAWVARSYLLHWSNGVSTFDWFAWDGYPWGALSISGSGINAAGVAYRQVYNWMVGATMSAPCAASGTVWTCGLTKPGSSQALAVWNTSGASTYPAGQYTQYRDLAGNTSAITGGSVTIGIKPILLE